MKSPQVLLSAVVLVSSLAFAAAPTSYQVTGEVVDVKGDVVTVMKGKEKFEIARPAGVTVEGGELTKGSKVTVEYTMTARRITVKGVSKAQAPAPAGKSEPAKPAARPAPQK